MDSISVLQILMINSAQNGKKVEKSDQKKKQIIKWNGDQCHERGTKRQQIGFEYLIEKLSLRFEWKWPADRKTN